MKDKKTFENNILKEKRKFSEISMALEKEKHIEKCSVTQNI